MPDLSITRTIVLDQKDFGITSEGFFLNKIDEYMEQFGFVRSRISTDQLYYQKMDPGRFFRRKDIIRNVLYTVECDQSEIRIELKTEVILLVFIALISTVFFPLLVMDLNALIPVGIAYVFCGFAYWTKLSVLNAFKAEVESLLMEYKK